MCGFYFSTAPVIDDSFEDVKQRGFDSCEFSGDGYRAIQSVMPTIQNNINFDVYDSVDYLFLFVGEVYSYDKSYNTDTEYVLDKLLQGQQVFDGMYAYILYNKHTKRYITGRDQSGQIPLYYSYTNGFTVSTTLKSMVKNLQPRPNPYTLEDWNLSKHYIFSQTCWEGISHVSPHKNNVRVYNKPDEVKQTLKELKDDYTCYLPSVCINSGGVDSGIVANLFDYNQVALNHVGKDYISNNLTHSIEITEKLWCNSVVDFINDTYSIPYSWSWIGYYIIGKQLQGKYNVLYTGEGADEIFGGYPGYKQGIRTPYSQPFRETLHNDPVVNNKLLDQKYFIPSSTMGANLALGCFTIESRNIFCDHRFINNKHFWYESEKSELKKIYTEIYKKQPDTKQGFAGYPDEFGGETGWKEQCFKVLGNIL